MWGDFEFGRIPGHFGPAWFPPSPGVYYKFKDRIN
jgi:hypothetical protein